MADIRYLTDHYDEKIKKIKSYNAPLNFMFITDQHNRMNEYITTWDKTKRPDEFELATNAIESMQYIIDRVPNMQCVISGGDIGNDYAKSPEKIRAAHHEIMDALYNLSIPVHCCIGNHDDGLGPATDRGMDNSHGILPEEMHELCMKYNPTDENYYYVDFEEQGYRFVFLNCLDRDYVKDENGQFKYGWRMEISNKQAVWLEKEALNTDFRVIVFNHTPLNNAVTFGSEGLPEGFKPYDDLLNGPRIFHAIRSSKNVVAYIFGHVHYDNLFYDTGILNVSTLCSLVQEWCPTCPKREYGTITETAFDVFSIKDNTVYITRFGAGEDRVGTIIK